MKKERLLRAIGEIDDDLIEEAAPQNKKIRKFPYKWISAAACLALVAILGIGMWQGRGINLTAPPLSAESGSDSAKNPIPNHNKDECLAAPKWSEMTPQEQYNGLKFDSVDFSGRCKVITAENIGALLGGGTAEGYDHYKDVTHTMNAAVYEIRGISRECAVAAQLEGRNDYFVYINHEYQPATLGDFIRDLNLKENIQFGPAYYEPDSHTELFEFTDIEDEKIWKMLLSDETVPAVKDNGTHVYKIYMQTGVPLLGYENLAFGVTEEGYLYTNLLDTSKVFYLGTEKTEAFKNYILENCEYRTLVYTTEPGDEVTE